MKNFVLCLGFIFVACTNIDNQKDNKYIFIKGLNAYESGNKVEALKKYKLAYSKGMREDYLLKEMAYLYVEFGDLERAKDLYIEILNREPEDEEALHNLLEIFYKAEDTDNIEKYSKNILNKNSYLYIMSQFNLAYIKKDYILARKILEESILNKKIEIFKKKYDKILFGKINDIYENHEKKDLLDLLNEMYIVNETNLDFIKYYFSVLKTEKQYGKAEKILMKTLVNLSDEIDVLLDLADMYLLENKQEKFENTMRIIEDKISKQQKNYNINKYTELKNKIKK